MSMVAVGGDDMVVGAHDRTAAGGDGLLSDIQMEKTSDFARLIRTEAAFFKTAYTDHEPIQPDSLVSAEGLVDGRLGKGAYDGRLKADALGIAF
jgi:hypothetical protein